jgi:hypothetical protein
MPCISISNAETVYSREKTAPLNITIIFKHELIPLNSSHHSGLRKRSTRNPVVKQSKDLPDVSGIYETAKRG